MGLFDTKLHSEGFTFDKQKQQEEKAHTLHKILSTDPDLKEYTSPTYPAKEQAKEKLSVTAHYASVFKKNSPFNVSITNLTLDNLKYVFDDKTAQESAVKYGNNVDKLKKDEGYNALARENNLPQKLIGGGEGEVIPIEGIDFKKMYNAEAKALITAYYSNPKNLKDLKKFLYSIAMTYAYPSIADKDELEKRLKEIDFSKLNDEEIRLEFQKIFEKINEENKGKVRFLNAMVDNLKVLEKLVNDYKNTKLDEIAKRYGEEFEK